VYGNLFMEVVVVITPRFALVCAEVLRDYCKENYSCDNGRCPGCIFSYPGYRTCYLSMFVGVDGPEMQAMARQKVDEREQSEVRRNNVDQRGEV
jgi:hypothetical protein